MTPPTDEEKLLALLRALASLTSPTSGEASVATSLALDTLVPEREVVAVTLPLREWLVLIACLERPMQTLRMTSHDVLKLRMVAAYDAVVRQVTAANETAATRLHADK